MYSRQWIYNKFLSKKLIENNLGKGTSPFYMKANIKQNTKMVEIKQILKSGGPGGTRTPDNAVMSGGF